MRFSSATLGPLASLPLLLLPLAIADWLGGSPRVHGSQRGAGEAYVSGETGVLGCRIFERYKWEALRYTTSNPPILQIKGWRPREKKWLA